jgi:DNA-binding FrmR family transcriptional regulator
MDDVADRGGPNVRCINFGQEPVLAPAHTADPKLVLLEFARIEDGVRRAQTLVEANAGIDEILACLATTIALLRQAGLLELERHVRNCVLGTGSHHGQARDEMLVELTDAVERLVRSLH